MHILICGAGAVGCILAAKLEHAGIKTTVLLKEEQKHTFEHHGISLEEKTGVLVAKPLITTTPSDNYSHLFLCTKAHDVPSVLKKLGKYKTLPVFCFQNGVRTEELVRASGFKSVYGVVTWLDATLMGPARVRNLYYDELVVGPVDTISKEIIDTLRTARFTLFEAPNIIEAKWGKLLFNLTNAFLGIVGYSYQQMYRDKNARKIMAAIVTEGRTVLDSAKIRYTVTVPFTIDTFVSRLLELDKHVPAASVKENFPSTYQDLAYRRGRTEAGDFNGSIILLGKKHKIKTPLNSFLLERVTEMAIREEPPGNHIGSDMRKLCALAKIKEE